jgi:hypothetical protein
MKSIGCRRVNIFAGGVFQQNGNHRRLAAGVARDQQSLAIINEKAVLSVIFSSIQSISGIKN